jgi:2-C-methyl-D-erythritol 4-phosphate cytidylyltransferase/2-C-methyl-D-erythritol 2,4-cyclodiphosphate synthase
VKLATVCVGAGVGSRFGADKLAEDLGGRPVLGASLEALRSALPEAPMVGVVAEERLEFWRDRLLPDLPDLQLVAGGQRRQDSVRAGVELAARDGAEAVVVHDAARPLVDRSDILAVVDALGEAAGAILTATIPDTVKRIDVDQRVVDTLPRDDLRLALTPQVFRVAALVEAWGLADPGREWTDESALLESLHMTVNSVDARHPNPKLTRASDLRLLNALLGAGA